MAPPMSRSSSSSTITLVSTPRLKAFEPECTTLTAAAVNKPLKAAFAASLAALDRPLRIVGLLATPDTGCRTYAEMTARACAASGVSFDLQEAEHSFAAVADAIRALNADPAVDGLIVYFPLFGAQDAALRALISPRIDVEGLAGLPRAPVPPGLHAAAYPCTALAVVRALQHPSAALYDASRPAGARFDGTVTVVNRSPTVGAPLARMLAADGARVFSVDIAGAELLSLRAGEIVTTPVEAGLEQLLGQSDAVVSAVPGSFCLDTAALKPGCVAVDLSEHGNFGADVCERARVFAPRIGGVTILMLQINALVLRRQREREGKL
jgi:methylenetetrahydrofolate dehydrogenase (NAD+)